MKFTILIAITSAFLMFNQGWAYSYSDDFITKDLNSTGDGLLTYIPDLNLEILDVTEVNVPVAASGSSVGHAGSHRAVSQHLQDGTAYQGFRFMSNSELYSVLDLFLDNPNSYESVSANEELFLGNFLTDIGSGPSPASFVTCDDPLGCLAVGTNKVTMSGGYQNQFYPNKVMLQYDGHDVGYQLLVRDFQQVHVNTVVSEPAAWLLAAFLPLMFYRRKAQSIR